MKLPLALAAALALVPATAALSLPLAAPDLLAEAPEGEENEAADYANAFFHVQNSGNRGEDVKTIQYLLRHRGYTSVPADGVFGSSTDSAVKSFQSSKGLAADGIVGASTWSALVVTVQQGSTGDAVRALQSQLNAKRSAGLAVDGVFGTGTKSAVTTFQSHAGISADGIVGPTTWKNLVWHYQKPAFSSGLCSYNGGNGAAGQWGTAAFVGQIKRAASVFLSGGSDGSIPMGDASLEHGGDIAGHASHEVGLDVDLRMARTDSAQCSSGCVYTQSCYDRPATKRMIDAIVDAAPGHVKLILFNDPQLNGYRGVVQPYANHDNHLHVRWCEKVHANSYYDC